MGQFEKQIINPLNTPDSGWWCCCCWRWVRGRLGWGGVLGGGPSFFMAKVGMPFPSRGFFSMAEKEQRIKGLLDMREDWGRDQAKARG